MSQYPDEAPAFSSDEETKNANGNKNKTVKTAKKAPETKTQPNKFFKENHHNAWIQFQRFPTQTRNPESDRRSRIRTPVRRQFKKSNKRGSLTSSTGTTCFVKPSQEWAKQLYSFWVFSTPLKCQETLSSASYFARLENWQSKSQKSSKEWESTCQD